MGHPAPRITEQQLELLKSFRYLTTDRQLADVKELLRLYFEQELDAAIDAKETRRGYTAEVYEAWLQGRRNNGQ